jgi:hypothetical protein
LPASQALSSAASSLTASTHGSSASPSCGVPDRYVHAAVSVLSESSPLWYNLILGALLCSQSFSQSTGSIPFILCLPLQILHRIQCRALPLSILARAEQLHVPALLFKENRSLFLARSV